MEFGLCLPNYGKYLSPESIVSLAMLAEELGYSDIWTTDHIVIGRRHPYPYGSIFESWTTLSYVAAKTSNIRLGTSIIVLPLRNAILLAKQAATLDNLTRGRLILGVGAGWERYEFEAMGASFKDRGKLMDEQIRLMKTLWKSGEPEFEGSYYRVRNVIFKPLPYRKGGPPIWVGGNSDRAVRRAIELGDGWHFTGLWINELKQKIKKIREARPNLTISGRISIDPLLKNIKRYISASGETRVILGGSPDQIAEQLSQYKRAGVNHVAVSLGDKPEKELAKLMNIFMREIIPSI